MSDAVHNKGSNSKGRVHSCKVSALPATICSVTVITLETLHEHLKTWAVQTTPVYNKLKHCIGYSNRSTSGNNTPTTTTSIARTA